ncbi:cold shock domain-containing protein [Candidatus Peribacteria bacterium]|nr:MAG: cold shock domain-containing protein [Candidatus Peribacteria bacterium]
MANGTIKKKMDDKGFGFIAVEGGGEDLFYHMSATNGQFESMSEGTPVSFDVEDSPKGKRAINVVAA